MVLGVVVGFLIMFAIMFTLIFAVAALVPFLMVFIAWDISILNINWEFVFTMLRINVLISVFIGIAFVISKDGREFAEEFYEYIKNRKTNNLKD